MDYINVAYHREFKLPIAASHDLEELFKLVDEYHGKDYERLGFYPSNNKYPDDFQGHLKYKSEDDSSEIAIYEVDFR